MTKNKNTEFEHTLQDILKADDLDISDSSSTENTAQNIKKPAPAVIQKKSKKYPKWLDKLVRIIAFIVVFFLLFLFAINVATR